MELFKYYNIDECLDKDKLFQKLDSLVNDGKIDYDLDGQILKIEDLDLEEFDIEVLVKLFDKLDVFTYTEYDEDDQDDDPFDELGDDDEY